MGFLRKLLNPKGDPSGPPERPDSAAAVGPSDQIEILDGSESLELVGESFYQDALQAICDHPSERVRLDVVAVLKAEEDNPYDSNAVSGWVNGLKVGHLSKEDAKRLRPGLIALEKRFGTAVAIPGVIVGGGRRADGPRTLGVFLRYDPSDFGVSPQPTPRRSSGGMRTGFSDALDTDAHDDTYDLSWRDNIPEDTIGAIKALREHLTKETDPIDRHFMFSQLESALYKSRDSFGSALDEFDECCRLHDAEMEGISQAFVTKWDKIPMLETYKQMCIRLAKAKDYEGALWWAERGIAIYGEKAAREDVVADLKKRADTYRTRLGKASN